MSGDEASKMIFERQGFLIVGSNRPRKVGDVIVRPHSNLTPGDQLTVALRIVEASTLQAFKAQDDLAEEIIGVQSCGEPDFNDYWKTIPLD